MNHIKYAVIQRKLMSTSTQAKCSCHLDQMVRGARFGGSGEVLIIFLYADVLLPLSEELGSSLPGRLVGFPVMEREPFPCWDDSSAFWCVAEIKLQNSMCCCGKGGLARPVIFEGLISQIRQREDLPLLFVCTFGCALWGWSFLPSLVCRWVAQGRKPTATNVALISSYPSFLLQKDSLYLAFCALSANKQLYLSRLYALCLASGSLYLQVWFRAVVWYWRESSAHPHSPFLALLRKALLACAN